MKTNWFKSLLFFAMLQIIMCVYEIRIILTNIVGVFVQFFCQEIKTNAYFIFLNPFC